MGSGSGRGGGSEGAGSSSGANGRGFDLNQPMVQRVEADAIENKDERRKHEFDLNELPPPEDDDQNKP